MTSLDAVNDTKKENHLLRLFCAITIMVVVLVHYWPIIMVGDYDFVGLVQGICRFGMPVFFMISGYFLFSNDGHSERSMGRRIKRLFILFLFIKFFYLGMDLILASFGYVNWNDILYNFIVFGDSTAQIWFIVVLLLAYVVHWILYHFHIDFKYFIPISVMLLVIDLIVAELFPILGIDTIFGLKTGDVNAGVYTVIGFFFFQAGYYIHKYKDRIDSRYSNKDLIVIMILSMALSLVEMFYCINTWMFIGSASYSPNITIGVIVFSFAFFVATFRVDDNHIRCRPLEWLGRNALAWMYAFVAIGSYPLKLFLQNAGYADDFFIYAVFGPIASIILDIVAAVFMYYLLLTIFGKKEKEKAIAAS